MAPEKASCDQVANPCRHAGAGLVFVRHPETRKNLIQGFGGGHVDNESTERGRKSSVSIMRAFSEFAAMLPQCCTISVWSSAEPRTDAVAERLARMIGAEWVRDPRLGPVNNGPLAGMTAERVSREVPEYFHSLQLYRRGLLNSYHLEHPGESLQVFETRVQNSLAAIEDSSRSLSIVFSHKSTIGASMIYFARKFCGYPRDFYGYIEVPTASISVISPARRRVCCVGDSLASLEAASLFGMIIDTFR